ncbi:phage terminase small subunit P27 family [Brevundimonas diminuta]|uniref:phage terminase small subunit P27 family n=1 Tax=Brevundimonas diminuta TaxID=293 RepID=UPI0032091C2B
MKGGKPDLRPDANSLLGTPKAPAWMKGAAKAEWNRVAPVLTERKILTDADLGGLENYCLAIGQVRDCQTTLAALPSPFFTADNGAPRPHPAIRVMHAAMTLARQLAAELGLTPVSRSRPAIRDDDDQDGGFDGLVD